VADGRARVRRLWVVGLLLSGCALVPARVVLRHPDNGDPKALGKLDP
jgi:hypothetical protein